MTDRDYSSNSDAIWKAIEALIAIANEDGKLPSAAQAFVALAICQAAKRNGSRESELVFVTSLPENEIKKALEQLDRLQLVRIDPSPRLIPAATEPRIYIPSRWARGKSVERITGPRVPSYVLNLSKNLTASNIEGKFKTSIEMLLKVVKERIKESDDQAWGEYVRFARIVLNQIKLCSIRARAMYGDYMPRKINDSISVLLETFDEIELNSETRQTALVLIGRAINLIRESLILT